MTEINLLSPPNDTLENFAKPWDGHNGLCPEFYKWSPVRLKFQVGIEHLREENLTIPETFVFQRGKDNFLAYSPIAGVIIQTNMDGLTYLRSLQHQYPNPKLQTNAPETYALVTSMLLEIGLLCSPVRVVCFPKRVFNSLHLFPTSNCNLKCVYCYADAGIQKKYMSWEIAKAGINFIVDESLTNHRIEFETIFQGVGEPFVALPILSRSVDYARMKAKKENLKCNILIATNGYLTSKKIDWAINNCDHLFISLDGISAVQDIQRNSISGEGSSTRVLNTITQIDRAGISYSLRTTVTDKSVDFLNELILFILDHFRNVKLLHIEPLSACDRSDRNGWGTPDPDRFVTNYLYWQRITKEYGLPLHYSGFAFDQFVGRHCDLENFGFAITPDGLVTICQEVSNNRDDRSAQFVYGRYNSDIKNFEFNWAVYDLFMQRTVEILIQCKKCAVRWHCGGECPSKLAYLGNTNSPINSTRCSINRLLFQKEILDYFDEQAKPLLDLNEIKLLDISKITKRFNYIPLKSSSTKYTERFTPFPTEVILLPTSSCNLNCRYCYATTNTKNSVMSGQIAKTAIDFVIGNAKKIGTNEVRIGFHGGEPFMA
ncbi:MAG: radical SAM protein [Flexilinea sp.]